MTKHALLFEPYKILADMLVLSMEELGFEVDIGSSSCDGDEALRARQYACVFIDLDQNFRGWHSHGLMLAEKASKLGLAVVMIPDDAEAQAVICAKGWLQISKPFKLAALEDVIRQATWAQDADAG